MFAFWHSLQPPPGCSSTVAGRAAAPDDGSCGSSSPTLSRPLQRWPLSSEESAVRDYHPAHCRRILSRDGAPVQVGCSNCQRNPQAILRVNAARTQTRACSAFRAIWNRRRSSSMSQFISTPPGRESAPKPRRSHAYHHQIASMPTRLGYGSRARFPGAVRKIPGTAMRGTNLSRGTSSFPDGGNCYVETDDREFCGHFRIHRCAPIQESVRDCL